MSVTPGDNESGEGALWQTDGPDWLQHHGGGIMPPSIEVQHREKFVIYQSKIAYLHTDRVGE